MHDRTMARVSSGALEESDMFETSGLMIGATRPTVDA